MGIEIERKFLVHRELLPALSGGSFIQQGYLSTTPAVRVRLVTSQHVFDCGFLTVKGPGFLKRKEYEYEIPAADASELLPLCESRLEKTRHQVLLGGDLWEIDVFSGSLTGLVLAEIELDSEDQRVALPPWVRQEVTGERMFTNAHLALYGLSSEARALVDAKENGL